MNKYYWFGYLMVLLLLISCNNNHPQVEAVLQQADALMDAHPDSAFSLLDSLHVRQPLSKKETARYALLLAKATDKTYQSLIPCDSLLNFALRYFDKPTSDRATALLYKACLEDEVSHDEDAIEHLQESRLILKDYPKEKSTRRITLGLLGDLYYQHKHYEDCLPVYQETLELCETDRDKALAYQDIGSYFTMTEQKDSAIFYHHEALKYTIRSKDSLLTANEYHYLALCHNVFSQVDSALYYENLALRNTPYNNSKGGIYYQIGSILQKSGNLKEAAYYLNMAKEDSIFNGSFMINRVLGQIKTTLGNYQEANVLYKDYIDYLDSLYTSERSVDVQKLIYDYENKLTLQDEQSKNEQIRNKLIIWGLATIFLILLLALYIYFIYKQSRQRHIHAMETMRLRLSALQDSIVDNQKTIEELNKEASQNLSDVNRLQLIIQEKEKAIKKYQKESVEISNRYFQNTSTYAEIVSGAKTSKSKKKLHVFNTAEQDQLKNEVFAIYDTYINQQKKENPSLKDEDLLLLCLESAGVSNQAIALCLGSIDPHIVYSRRIRMRDRFATK